MGNLQRLENAERAIVYDNNADTSENAHGRNMINMCKNLDLYPVNHLNFKGRRFKGAKTYRKGETWISQLDWLFCSSQLLQLIQHFAIAHNAPFMSDHAALIATLECPTLPVDYISERTKLLGCYQSSTEQRISSKPMHLYSLSSEDVETVLPDPASWWDHCGAGLADGDDSANELNNRLSEILYNACKRAGQTDGVGDPAPATATAMSNAHARWQVLVAKKDPKLIWSSINWKGDFELNGNHRNKPSDEDFRQHFEKLLNPPTGYIDMEIPNSDMYVPVLDDPITPAEVDAAIRKLRRNKAAGIDGVPPGIFKLLSSEWLGILTVLFNLVFSGKYPDQWSYAKIFTIFNTRTAAGLSRTRTAGGVENNPPEISKTAQRSDKR